MFIDLHVRSAFSFLEGACVPEELAGACAHFEMPAMAKVGLKAHIGLKKLLAISRWLLAKLHQAHKYLKLGQRQLIAKGL
jgi:hypothetical protein